MIVKLRVLGDKTEEPESMGQKDSVDTVVLTVLFGTVLVVGSSVGCVERAAGRLFNRAYPGGGIDSAYGSNGGS